MILFEIWTPVRFVPPGVSCDFCWRAIPRGAPGRSTGTRGTKAYYSAKRRVYECLSCHDELTRVELGQVSRS